MLTLKPSVSLQDLQIIKEMWFNSINAAKEYIKKKGIDYKGKA